MIPDMIDYPLPEELELKAVDMHKCNNKEAFVNASVPRRYSI